MTVTAKDGKLFAKRGSGNPAELIPELPRKTCMAREASHGIMALQQPESPDLFFRRGVEGRRLFHRDARGRVDSLIDRRNNEDMLWKKIG